jgi:hypothetical protein
LTAAIATLVATSARATDPIERVQPIPRASSILRPPQVDVGGWSEGPDDGRVTIERHAGRALLMELAGLAGGTIWYWRHRDFNSKDWDLHWDWPSWRKKLLTTEVLKFDTNDMNTNAGNHLTAGALYYLVGRANGFDLPASWAMNVASDFVWEYAVEYREYPSVNDLIVTGMAGPVVGEPILQLGHFFRRSLPNRKNRALAIALSPVEWLTGWMDDREWGEPDLTDDRGLTIERGHVFRFFLSERAVTFNGAGWRRDTTLGADLEVMMPRGYGQPGRWATWTRTGAFSRVVLSLSYLEGVHLSSLFRTKTTVRAHYRQDIVFDDESGASRRGYSLLLGVGTGFEYETRRLAAEGDRRAVVNVVGPLMDWNLYAGPLTFRWEVATYGDFAMVDSFALGPEFRPSSTPPLTTVLRAHGYYYAGGATGLTRARLSYKRVSLMTQALANHFVSIDSLSRARTAEDAGLSALTDDRLDTVAALVVRPWAGAVAISAFVDWVGRRGTIDNGRASRTGHESAAGVQLSFAP